jgi:FtsH-binding integral membrane protein
MISAYLTILGAIAITGIIFSIIHWILKKEFNLFNERLLWAFIVVWVTLSLLLGKFFGTD